MAGRVSLQDVASAAGVSKGLASRALAGYPEVAAGTRERVSGLARAMGYRASARARALAAGKNAPARCLVASLGLTPDALGRSFYGPILTGITAQASTEGLDIRLAALPGIAEHAVGMLAQLVAEDRADAAILLTFFPLTAEVVQPLEQARMPFVLVNRYLDGHPVNCVTPDWAGATSQAVTHLVSLGHRRLALLLPDSPVSTVRDHAAGWMQGLARAALDPTDAPIFRFAGQESGAFGIAQRLFAGRVVAADRTPTAIVCMNDVYAHGVLTAAAAAGLAVP
ncbi:MAG TPA: LacI family DNA-binding transcriptional regulator, partial [Chloroflexota bacterium]|nr:LacI family DNA-binding transcriptional regulator [Chloroflexota bacterium]